MLFYFVRHGQTAANHAHLLAGSGLDHPLNQTGHEQARQLARELKRHIPHRLHRVIASNMTRARQTGGYLAEALNLELEIIPDFREWNLGEWEGKTFAEFGHLILGDGEPQQGEPRQIFYSRVERAWKSVHLDSQPYLIVSHGAVWLAMQDLLQIPRFKIENCQIVRLRFERERWTAEILS